LPALLQHLSELEDIGAFGDRIEVAELTVRRAGAAQDDGGAAEQAQGHAFLLGALDEGGRLFEQRLCLH
jgi:hypothetical protein